jgi:polyhydroxyalkanoate synthesis repressor PhaR
MALHRIKRYANRKLYDTSDKRYVTLDELAELVRQGAEVVVHDNETGDDITSMTLAQILCEQQKRSETSLPGALLHALIQAPRGPLRDGLQRLLASGIHLVRHVERGGERLLHALSETQPSSARSPSEDLEPEDAVVAQPERDNSTATAESNTTDILPSAIEDQIKMRLDEIDAARSQQLHILQTAIERLEQRLERIEADHGAPLASGTVPR